MSKFAILPSKVTVDIQTLEIERLVEAGVKAWAVHEDRRGSGHAR